MSQPPAVADLSRSLRAAYQQAQEALDAELASIEANPARYARASRLRELQRSVQGMTDQLDEQARDWLSTSFPTAYAIGAQSVGEFAWTQADRFAITQLAQDSFDDLLKATQHVDDTTKALVRALGKNAALLKETTGRTATAAGKRLAKLLESKGVGTVTYANGSKHGIGEYSDMLLRTVSAQAHNLGTLNFGSRTGTKYYEVGDGSDCGTVSHEDADKANRQIWPIEKCREFSLAHPRCVAEGTAVEPLGAITAGYMARWVGPAVVIRTAGGSRLTVTPNHPVLTGRGWVAAKFLNEGDQVVRRTGEVGRADDGTLPTYRHLNQVPALIEDVFDALRAGGSDASAVPAPEDFHGDAERMVGEVHVVDADRHLLGDDHAPVPEQLLELSLVGADVVHPLGVGPGSLLLSPLRLRTTRARRRPARLHVPGVGVGRTDRDAPLLEPITDDQIADADFLRQLRRRFAVQVSLDTVIEVRDDEPMSGHVYDLSTKGGAYFAEGILVHNCRRSFFGRPELQTPQDAREAKSLITDEQQADQTAAEKARAAGFKAKADTQRRRAQSRRKVEARKAQSQARVDASETPAF